MQTRALGNTGFSIAPIVLGGNVFGWTIDEKQSFAVLDAFVDHGFNAIDTADSYSTWAPGNKGGESETIIGNWLKANPSKRDKVVVFTKVGSEMNASMTHKDLSARWILEEAENSLRRLGVDSIDLYFSHWHDPRTPYAETLEAYGRLMKAGKVKSIGASNLDATQLAEALKVANDSGLPRYQVLQPEYNLYARAGFESELRDLCIAECLGVVNYYALASGFLTGKYRSEQDFGKSQRGGGMSGYLNARGHGILSALDQVSSAHGVSPAEIALAWLIASPGVTAPIASATSPAQVASFAAAAALKLTSDEKAALDRASN